MKRILPLAFVALLCGSASAYDIEQLRADAQAHYAKMASVIKDVRIEQSGEFLEPGREGTLSSVMYRKGDRWRTEGKMTPKAAAGPVTDKGAQVIESVQVFDGTDIWQSAMGVKTKVQGFSQSRGPSTMNSFGSELPEDAKIGGEEKVGDRDCWIVESPRPAASNLMEPQFIRTWIDKNSFCWVKSETDMGSRHMSTVFSDFRKVEGFDIPYLTEVFADGQKTMTAKVEKLEVNLGLADDLFDPEKLPGKDMRAMNMGAMQQQVEEMKQQAAARKAAEAAGNAPPVSKLDPLQPATPGIPGAKVQPGPPVLTPVDPAQAKPAETKPKEAKPAETQPADGK